jgi:DNA-binding HxlR family transcriptional regulator
MKRSDLARLNCSVARSLDVVGEWWSLLVVRDVAYGLTRFSDIQRSLGIARNILADRLGTLVDAGILTRVPDPDDGRSSRYLLTEKGQGLVPVLLVLMAWGDRWQSPDGPPLELIDKRTGERVDLTLIDRNTGEPVPHEHVRFRRGPGYVDASAPSLGVGEGDRPAT